MKFDYTQEPMKEYPNFKGGEKSLLAAISFDGLNRVLRGRLVPGASIGLHTHDDSSEVIYVIAGEPSIITDGQAERYAPGQAHYCPKGHAHTMVNDTAADVEFFAVVPIQ